jgi:hypothetical protein
MRVYSILREQIFDVGIGGRERERRDQNKCGAMYAY